MAAAAGNTKGIDRLARTLALDESVETVKLVSASRARALAKMGIATVRDLLQNYPRRYIDMSSVCTIASAVIGTQCTVKGRIESIQLKHPRRRLDLVEIGIVDDTGIMISTSFRQPWLADRLKAGMSVAVSGKVEFNYGFKRMVNPYIEQIEEEGAGQGGLVIAVHPLTGSISAGMMRRLVANACEKTSGCIDPLPLALRVRYRLMGRSAAYSCIHFPHDMAERDEARRRLAYEEVLVLELLLMRQVRMRNPGQKAHAHEIEGPHLRALEQAVPFDLTCEQEEARKDILGYMASERPMNHMLLGDVGTGKTVVAAFALACAADSGTQAALMAPTEILARQHAATLGPLFDKAGITWELLVGALTRAEKEAIAARVSKGAVDVLIGTHAILEDGVRFGNLSLAVIDEQQRFGVEQRAALLAKGACPDALFLTATPIPRTLALALYGGLTLSYLKARPGAAPDRVTYVHAKQERGRAYDAARDALARGEQVYVVCPLIDAGEGRQGDDRKDAGLANEDDDEYLQVSIEADEDMDACDVAAARSHADFLQKKVFPEYSVGLLHGRLDGQAKSDVMEGFRSGRTKVLVATTVIEVGVDVPQATVMIVEDADRFGLAQLHQLRGRVGRGNLPGQFHAISSSRNPQALERLHALESIDDGFELATYDLSLRREGDLLGNRQHGASSLKLVNVVRDARLIEAAHADAQAMIEQDPGLDSAELRALGREVRMLERRIGTVQGG